MRVLAWGAVALIACGYLWFVRKNCAPYASNSDASGYLNCTRLLLAGEPMRAAVPRIAGLDGPTWDFRWQEPLGYRVFEDGTYAPMVPAGYPLQLAAASWVVGIDWATVLVNVVVVGGLGAVMVVLARQAGLGWGWALGGVALLWASPLFVYISLQPISDVPATFWCAAAVAAAWQARRHAGWGVAAGAAVAMAVLVRPTDVLVMLPVAVALGGRWRAWLALAAGGAPGAAFWVGYNLRVFGAAVTTGYGDMTQAFGWKFVPENLRTYGLQTPMLIGPLVVAAVLSLPWCRSGVSRAMVMLLVWSAAFFGFYGFCMMTSLSWSMRYVLPAFPPLIVLALMAGEAWARRWKSATWRWAAPVAVLGLALAGDVAVGRERHVVIMKRGEAMYVETIRWVQAHVPANAIVIAKQATGAFTFYAKFPLVRYEFMPLDALQRVYTTARANGQEVYAVLFDPERDQAFRDKLKDGWREVVRVRSFTVWKRVEAGESGAAGANKK